MSPDNILLLSQFPTRCHYYKLHYHAKQYLGLCKHENMAGVSLVRWEYLIFPLDCLYRPEISSCCVTCYPLPSAWFSFECCGVLVLNSMIQIGPNVWIMGTTMVCLKVKGYWFSPPTVRCLLRAAVCKCHQTCHLRGQRWEGRLQNMILHRLFKTPNIRFVWLFVPGNLLVACG